MTADLRAADADTNVVLAVTEDRQIAGFGVFAPPGADDRWSQMQPAVIATSSASEETTAAVLHPSKGGTKAGCG